ncbi:hypothetical protein N2152v2_004495 [Parachlorella kessleri]
MTDENQQQRRSELGLSKGASGPGELGLAAGDGEDTAGLNGIGAGEGREAKLSKGSPGKVGLGLGSVVGGVDAASGLDAMGAGEGEPAVLPRVSTGTGLRVTVSVVGEDRAAGLGFKGSAVVGDGMLGEGLAAERRSGEGEGTHLMYSLTKLSLSSHGAGRVWEKKSHAVPVFGSVTQDEAGWAGDGLGLVPTPPSQTWQVRWQ